LIFRKSQRVNIGQLFKKFKELQEVSRISGVFCLGVFLEISGNFLNFRTF
jgi:hypothetical protein